jgi:hypothetical protein
VESNQSYSRFNLFFLKYPVPFFLVIGGALSSLFKGKIFLTIAFVLKVLSSEMDLVEIRLIR